MSDLSPLGKLYEDDGYILLLGVEHSSNTSLHLAETRIDGFPTEIQLNAQSSKTISESGKSTKTISMIQKTLML